MDAVVTAIRCVCTYILYSVTSRCKLKIGDISSIIARCDEELTKLRKPARNVDIPAGLENNGNWCFINVVLQCLFSLWPFRCLLY